MLCRTLRWRRDWKSLAATATSPSTASPRPKRRRVLLELLPLITTIPLDTAKVRLQLQKKAIAGDLAGPKYRGLLGTTATIAKIALSESSLSRTKQDFTIFAAKLQGIDGPNSAHVLLAYGSVVKPSFDKLLVCYGKDINLGVSEDGVLLPTVQPTMPQERSIC